MNIKRENLNALLTALGYPVYPPKPANSRQVIYFRDTKQEKERNGKSKSQARLF